MARTLARTTLNGRVIKRMLTLAYSLRPPHLSTDMPFIFDVADSQTPRSLLQGFALLVVAMPYEGVYVKKYKRDFYFRTYGSKGREERRGERWKGGMK